MKKLNSIATIAGMAALVSATAALAADAPAAKQTELAKIAAAARLADVLPGMPLGLSVALDAVAAPAPAPRGMKSATMPENGMIVVARVAENGELETLCVNSQAAADAFLRGGRPAVDPKEQH